MAAPSAQFRDLDDRAPMSPAQINKVIVHINRLRQFDRKPHQTVRAWLNALGANAGAA